MALDANVVEVTAGIYSSCARQMSGAVSCWGWNQFGQLGDGSVEFFFRVANTPVQVKAPGRRFQSIAVVDGASCASNDLGIVMCWGRGGFTADGTSASRFLPQATSIQVRGLQRRAAARATHERRWQRRWPLRDRL